MSDPVKILVVLVLYAFIFLVVWYDKKKLDAAEKKTFWVFYFFWSITIFIANYLGYLIGVFSFLPWFPNNFLHTFAWIGIVLTWMFLALRHHHVVVQFMAFAGFSLVVRVSEYNLFGVWDLDHFLFVFQGTDAYIIGWSVVDGLYPIAAFLVLHVFRKFISGLIPPTRTAPTAAPAPSF